ncbi:Glutathione S-transferase [Chondrus crispus]|uniref:Glutathione S-transferase n=1 Tax=Chondrus crispus TaxID=2769 RepID=B1N8I3_CHOCR|nr:Glutathione S-transferase [Chondrus crispus]ABR14709.1 glutathione S-transferase [Chondrus crispus]CDF35921.1 Glutathione S-transferase [Chondrus crispus]|eukprot:XP_005715740.1 Glutathione S-transferase [Chondrus crispus]
MPEIKLTYFDMRGRAEASRLALVVGEIPFEDERVVFDHWKEAKPKTPYAALPMLTVDGMQVAQSDAILRYCGKLAGLYPSDPLEAAKVDEVGGVIDDVTHAMYRYRGDDKDKLREERDKFSKVDVPRYVGALEKRLEAFGDGPWAVGGNMTIADLHICHLVTNIRCGMLDFVDKDLLEGYVRIVKSYSAVMEHPKVTEWYEKKPVKMFS